MASDLKKTISSTVLRILRPIVKILLRNGIPFGAFNELAKWVYVDTALKEFAIPGRKQSISHVAIITGLSRKEVKRIKEIPEAGDLGSAERYNRAIRVISGWRKDPRFLDADGKPRELPLEGEKASFSYLVKAHSGDVPPRAVLDEMVNAGVVELINDSIRLLSRGYIVRKGEIEKFNILGADVSELITTINHNIECPPSEVFLQRKVSYDNIPEDALPELKEIVLNKGKEFIQSIDHIISEYDRDVNSSVKGKGRKKAGLGIFYFE